MRLGFNLNAGGEDPILLGAGLRRLRASSGGPQLHDVLTWKAEMHEKDKKRVLDHAMALLSSAVDAERKRVRLMQQ